MTNREWFEVYRLEIALERAIIELEYAHSRLGNDHSLTRGATIEECKLALAVKAA